MDPLLEDSIPHRKAADLAKAMRRRRNPTRFEVWAFSPILAFRIGLTAVYIATVYFGVAAFIAGVPAFALTAPPWWVFVWSIGTIIGGFIATFGSLHSSRRFENVEMVGATLLFITLGSYSGVLHFLAYGNGDASRVAVAAGFLALGAFPGIRMIWLMSRLRMKPAEEPVNPSHAEGGPPDA